MSRLAFGLVLLTICSIGCSQPGDAGVNATANPATATTGIVTVSNIGKDKLGQRVTIEGSVDGYKPSRHDRAPHAFFLKDSTNSIRVAIWPDVFGKIQYHEAISGPNVAARLTGEVAEFQGKLELHVKNPTDIVLGSAPAAAPTPAPSGQPASDSNSTLPGSGASTITVPVPESPAPTAAIPIGQASTAAAGGGANDAPPAAPQVAVNSITKAQTGEFVMVEGATESYKPSDSERAPHSFQLNDGTSSIRVAIWPNIFEQIAGKEALSRGGVKIRLTAEVAEFQGKTELHVGDPNEVVIGGPASPAVP